MVYLLSKIKVLNKSIQKLNLIISKNQKDWVYIIIIIILLSFLIVFNKNNLGSGINYYINAGMVIFIIASFVYVIYNKFQMQAIEDKYNESMEYVLRYEKIINEQGKKNHEYNNQLMVIKGYINKPERLSEYLDEVIGEHKTGQNYTVKQLGFLPDGGVKGLLYHKLSKMEDNNIKYYLYVDQNLKDKDIESFDLKTYRDLTKLLGVFLDNAIDAALKSEEKEIEVELKDKDDCLLLTISNTYDKNTDINKVGKSGFTTKGVGHGFGLSIVKDIAKTNSEIETFSSKESDKFIQTAMIYFKK
ncbi:sensor histidine kinase accessory gene regulator protein C putative [Clostridium sp. CAG:433]|nr:sensor histidine kinase accessory gene regulator protein C putative [Clostridium sp. CAG:433]